MVAARGKSWRVRAVAAWRGCHRVLVSFREDIAVVSLTITRWPCHVPEARRQDRLLTPLQETPPWRAVAPPNRPEIATVVPVKERASGTRDCPGRHKSPC